MADNGENAAAGGDGGGDKEYIKLKVVGQVSKHLMLFLGSARAFEIRD